MGDPRSIELRVEAGLEQVRLVGVTVRAVAEQFVAPARAQLIELCTVEIATNCVKHAYEGRPGHSLRVCISLDDNEIIVEVRDEGKAIPLGVLEEDRNPFGFDPDETQALPEGGMGLALVSAMAEDSEYFRDGDENVMRMRFQRARASQTQEAP